MLKATDFEILRKVASDPLLPSILPRKPVMVATLLDEEEFCRHNFMAHHGSVFFEDFIHDWDWVNGKFRYYSRISNVADVLVVYAYEEVEPALNFDPMTGKPLKGTA